MDGQAFDVTADERVIGRVYLTREGWQARHRFSNVGTYDSPIAATEAVHQAARGALGRKRAADRRVAR